MSQRLSEFLRDIIEVDPRIDREIIGLSLDSKSILPGEGIHNRLNLALFRAARCSGKWQSRAMRHASYCCMNRIKS